MRFFNVEIPDEDFPHYANYITVDQDGKIDAWNERPARGATRWYAAELGTELGYTDDTEEWDTHMYIRKDTTEPWQYFAVHSKPEYIEGRKDDAAKLRYDLLPPHALEQLTAVLTYGAEKYGANNWKQVPCAQDRYYAAALRHVQAWRQGELIDPESGLPHLAHAMCCLVFLLGQNDER